MWPERGEALDHTIRVEAAVSDLYAEALRRWSPTASAAVLPALTASTLPPDPAAMSQTQSVWEQHADAIVLAGIGVVWAVAVYETAKQFSELPDAVTPDVSTVVLGIVLASLLMPKREVLEAVGYVESTPTLAAARDEFLTVKRAEVASTPLKIQAKVEAAINEPLLTMSVIPEDRPEVLRVRAAEVLEASSPEMRDIARNEGYQAAEVLNHAVIAAAADSDEDLDKVWLCVHPDTVVSASGVTHLARRHYKGPLVSVRTASGATVALTPEHRVLTGRGWLGAKFLNESDSLFKVHGVDPSGAPQIEDAPALIGQVVDAAMNDRPAEVRTVRHGVDLDSDAGSGYVDVVAANSDLTINAESGNGKALSDFLLTDADLLGKAAVFRRRRLPQSRRRLGPATVLGSDALVEIGLDVVGDLGCPYDASGGFVSNLDACGRENVCDLNSRAVEADSERLCGFTSEVSGDDFVSSGIEIVPVPRNDGEFLCGPHLRNALGGFGAELASFSHATQDTVFAEPSTNRFGASAEVCGDGNGSLPREVSADDFTDVELDPLGALLSDRVVGIELISHDGFVYDLSTSSHWYLAGDLVVHNCTLDGKTRATHWAADGQRAPLAGTFTVGQDQLAYPGDPAGPPAEVKNCRCRVGVLAKDEDIPDEVDRHTERLDGRDSVAINRDGRTQSEEIKRRADDGNIRARDDPEGIGRVASGGWTAPSEQENTMAKTATTTTIPLTVAGDGAVLADGVKVGTLTAAAESEDGETFLTFTDALFAVTGTPTSDRRMLAADIDLTFRDTPMPLQWCEKMEGGHTGSVTVGVIEAIRNTNGEIRGDGYMLNNEHAAKAIDLLAHGVCQPSIDYMAEDVPTYEDGTLVTEENYDPDLPIYMTSTKGEVMATTIVAIPAFGQTRLSLNEEREPRAKAVVASAAAQFAPRVYDPALFADPKLTGPTHLTITDDGHIFGHIAEWNVKHRSVGLGHITPPRSNSDYSHFHSSPPVRLSDGTTLAVGRLTVGIGHAPTMGISNASAQAHYDNAESCFALVRAYEDAFGIVVSGVAAPWASPEKIEMGLASPMSGDWRPYNNKLDLVAVLAVNTPGFLVCGTGSGGKQLALVASFSPSRQVEAGGITHLSVDDIKAIVTESVLEANRRAALAALAETAFAEARELVGPPPPVLTVAEQMDQLLAGIV